MFGVILFAHGSRDPRWHEPVQAVAARLRTTAPQVAVRCAYLELTAPDLASAAAELVAEGASTVRILPLFLGTGRHAREHLPELLSAVKARHPQVRFELAPAIGEDTRVINLLAELALAPLDA